MTLLHFHLLHFRLCLTGKRILFCNSGNCDLTTALKHVAQKEGRLASYVNGGYVCKSQRKGDGYILKVSEAHGSIIILLYYLHVWSQASSRSWDLPRGYHCAAEKWNIYLTLFVPRYYFATMSASVYFPQTCAEVGPLPNAQHRGC